MKKLFTLALFALFATLSFAQNAPLPTQTWTTDFTSMALPGAGQTFVGTAADVGVSFTPDTNVFFETIQSPSAPNFAGFYGPGVSYQINALSKFINDRSPLSGFKLRFSVLGSFGESRIGDRNHFAGTARFRTEYALNSDGKFGLAVEVGAARLYTGPGWQKIVSLGLPIHF